MDPQEVAAMMEWLKPKTPKALQGFLGLTSYYRKFIHDYRKIALPLTNMLKKDSFTWTSTSERSFQDLKEAMTQAPVLALPNFAKCICGGMRCFREWFQRSFNARKVTHCFF